MALEADDPARDRLDVAVEKLDTAIELLQRALEFIGVLMDHKHAVDSRTNETIVMFRKPATGEWTEPRYSPPGYHPGY